MEAEDDCWSTQFGHRLRIYSTTSETSDFGETGFVEPGELCPEVLHNQAMEFAAYYHGHCVHINGTISVTFQCNQGHHFERKFGELLWCQQCTAELDSVNQYAKGMGGSCESEFLAKNLEFRCAKGHRFRATVKQMKRWCRVCSKRSYQERKRAQKSTLEGDEVEYRRIQQELFEEARNQFAKDSVATVRAKALAREFMEAQEPTYSAKLTFQKVLSVYQILETPSDMLEILLKMDKKFFRAYAKDIHPDKNGHPQATQAFMKLANAFKL